MCIKDGVFNWVGNLKYLADEVSQKDKEYSGKNTWVKVERATYK